MAFVVLEDIFSSIELVLFPKIFDKYRALLNEYEKVLVKGRASFGADENGKLIVDTLVKLGDKSCEL